MSWDTEYARWAHFFIFPPRQVFQLYQLTRAHRRGSVFFRPAANVQQDIFCASEHQSYAKMLSLKEYIS